MTTQEQLDQLKIVVGYLLDTLKYHMQYPDEYMQNHNYDHAITHFEFLKQETSGDQTF